MPGWPRRHWWLLALFGSPCERRGCSAGIGGCLPDLATHANAGAAAPALVAACLIWQLMRTPGLQRRHWWLLALFGNGGCLPYLATHANAGVATPALVDACLIWQPMRMPGLQRRHWWLLGRGIIQRGGGSL